MKSRKTQFTKYVVGQAQNINLLNIRWSSLLNYGIILRKPLICWTHSVHIDGYLEARVSSSPAILVRAVRLNYSDCEKLKNCNKLVVWVFLFRHKNCNYQIPWAIIYSPEVTPFMDFGMQTHSIQNCKSKSCKLRICESVTECIPWFVFCKFGD